MKKIVALVLAFIVGASINYSVTAYQFNGIHYMASFRNCNEKKLNNIACLHMSFLNGIRASGAKILGDYLRKFECDRLRFPEHIGLTSVAILSESSATLHSYPEHRAVFLDLFTCGDTCDWRAFHKTMIAYLEPEDFGYRILERF